MKQILTEDIGKFVYKEVPDPKPNKGEALIEIKSIGICSSDITSYQGIIDLRPVMGHEFGGIIKEINDKNYEFKVGDKVSVYPQLNCGSCYYCTTNLEHLCSNQLMFGSPELKGGLSELVAVPINNLVKMSNSFNIEYAGLIEPAAVSLHTVRDIKNSNLIVIGTGSIGVMMGPIIKQNNSKFIAMDIDDNSLDVAKDLGADITVNLNNKKRTKIIEDFLGEEKVDVVVMTFINKKNLDFAIDIVRKHGTIIIMAISTESIELDFNVPLFKEISFKWSICYSYEEFKQAAKLIEDGIIDCSKIITKIFPFDKIKEAFEYKINNSALKVLITNL